MRMHGELVALAAVVSVALAPAAALAEAIEAGQVVEDGQLQDLDGGNFSLLARDAVNVLVFFRPGHDHSLEALRAVGASQAAFAGKPVQFAGVVSDDAPREEVRAALTQTHVELTVLLDAGDAVYARLGIRAFPTVAIVDRHRRLVAFERFHPVGYTELIRSRIRLALGEISAAEMATVASPAPSQLPGDDPEDVPRRHVNLGRKLLAAKLYAQAHDQARKSISLRPNAAAWVLEGDVFAEEGKCAEAGHAFESALKLDPAHEGAKAGKGRCGR